MAKRSLLDLAGPAVLVVTILAFAAGSSSLHSVVSVGKVVKWPALGVLDVVAVVALAASGPGRRIDRVSVGILGSFAAVIVVSCAWSVDPRVSVERGVSMVMVLVAAAALSLWAVAEVRAVRAILFAILCAVAIMAVLGVLVLLADRSAALVSSGQGALGDHRFQGFGGNPDANANLFAVVLPLALWAGAVSRSRRERLVAFAAALLFAVSIVASGSRGAVLAAIAGGVVYLVVTRVSFNRIATVSVAVIVVLCIGGIVGAILLSPSPQSSDTPGAVGRLVDELGWGGAVHTSLIDRLTGSSGRVLAWKGAIAQGNQRPILGYGFGMEDQVFIDRWYAFQGARPENSYIGMYLQLGAVGLAVMLAFFARMFVLLRRAPRRARRWEPMPAAVAAALAAALVAAAFQSYVYAAGNVSTLSVWVIALAALGLCPPTRERP